MGRHRDWSKVEEIVRKIQELGLSYRQGAEHFGIKVSVLYEYNKKLKAHLKKKSGPACPSSACLEEESPSGSHSQTADSHSTQSSSVPQEIEQLIVAYRQDNPDHGYRRIEDYLKHKHFVVVSRKKIREVLKKHGLHRGNDSSFDCNSSVGQAKGTGRFEAPYPRSLYQTDIMYVYLESMPVFYLVTVLDDYSRFCVVSELVSNQRGVTMIEVLHRAIERYGKPKRLLTDQGRSFYSWSFEQTQFQHYLDDRRIEHIVADPHSPTTLGKVERWHQSIQGELLHKKRFNSLTQAREGIAAYVNEYNYTRSHQGIDGLCPADRFFGIDGEKSRHESTLISRDLDISKGYLILKSQSHTVSIGYSNQDIVVYRNGVLLQEGVDDALDRPDKAD